MTEEVVASSLSPALQAAIIGLIATIAVGGVSRLVYSWVARVTSALETVSQLAAKVERLEEKDMEDIVRRLDRVESGLNEVRVDAASSKATVEATKEAVDRIETTLSQLVRHNRRPQ
jgi:outer membrane murein-binding lipoprotein Lpp